MALSSKLAKASDERAALSAIVPELNTLYTFFVPEPESLLSEHSNVQEILDRAVETFDTAQQVP